jgi:hypothetical protein
MRCTLRNANELRRCELLLIFVLLIVALSGCQTGDRLEIPPETQFQVPALGTPIPVGAGSSSVTLPDNGSGALFINNAGTQVRVVVSNTIVSIQPTAGFLFVLPAGSYQFYIYGLESLPQLHTEKIEPGKIRYVYLLPALQ